MRRRKRLKPIIFAPVENVFKPQVEVLMLKSVSGWVDRARGIKFALDANETYMIDEDRATEFIVKGYARGQMPREVSEEERQAYLAQMTTVKVAVNG